MKLTRWNKKLNPYPSELSSVKWLTDVVPASAISHTLHLNIIYLTQVNYYTGVGPFEAVIYIFIIKFVNYIKMEKAVELTF